MQVGPLAIIGSLLDRKQEPEQEETKPFQKSIDRPRCSGQEYYAYQDERFDLVIYDWNCDENEFFDEDFVTGLGQIIKGYIADPINEKDHAWANM